MSQIKMTQDVIAGHLATALRGVADKLDRGDLSVATVMSTTAFNHFHLEAGGNGFSLEIDYEGRPKEQVLSGAVPR